VQLSSEATGDRFALTRSGEGYKGTFTTAKGVQLPVILAPVPKGSVPDPQPDLQFREPLSDYARLRLADVKFVDGRKETVGGKYVIQWYQEPLSKIEMFRVVEGYPEPVMKSMGRVVSRDFYAALDAYFSCGSEEGSGSGVEQTKVSSRFLNDRLVSYAVSSSWSCRGSAHPDASVEGTTLDARTGRELELENVWWLGSGAVPAPRTEPWFKYRNEVFAPGVVALFKQLYPEQMKPDPDGCDYSVPDPWSIVSWYVGDKGLYLGAYFPRVARACDNPDWSYVPYEVLRKNNPALFGSGA